MTYLTLIAVPIFPFLVGWMFSRNDDPRWAVYSDKVVVFYG